MRYQHEINRTKVHPNFCTKRVWSNIIAHVVPCGRVVGERKLRFDVTSKQVFSFLIHMVQHLLGLKENLLCNRALASCTILPPTAKHPQFDGRHACKL